MNNKVNFYLPLSFEYLVSNLFGKKTYHGYAGLKDLPRWKKDLKKILKYIKKSIELNIVSDVKHKKKLTELCDAMDASVSNGTTFDQINIAFIENSVKLIFSFLGDMPEHWHNSAPWQDNHWKLNKFRHLIYVQTDAQKVDLIFHHIKNNDTQKIDLLNYQDIEELFYAHCKGNPLIFIQWIKENYPKIYCDIF